MTTTTTKQMDFNQDFSTVDLILDTDVETRVWTLLFHHLSSVKNKQGEYLHF
jgi:hypothetical protein